MLNIDDLQTARISATDVKITTVTLGDATIDGDRTAITSTAITKLALNAKAASVIVSGPIGELTVTGTDNVINWTGGATEPSAPGNTYTRTPG